MRQGRMWAHVAWHCEVTWGEGFIAVCHLRRWEIT